MASTAPGAERYQALLDGGASMAQAEQWRAETDQTLRYGGATEQQINEYWGLQEFDPAKERQRFENAHDNAPKEASGPIEYIEAGLQQSVGSLILGKPNVVLPKDAGLFAKILSGASTAAADIPAYIAGGLGGAAIGGAAGSEVPVVGNAAGAVAGATFGAGFLPSYLRRGLMDRYEKGEATSWREYWGRIGGSFMEGVKGGEINAIAGPIGGAIGGQVLKKTGSELLSTASNLVTQAATMTSVGAALDGKVPDLDDFIVASATIGGLHVAYNVIAARPTSRIKLTPAGEIVAKNLRDLYARTGMSPNDAADKARTDPAFRAEILGIRSGRGEPRIDGQAEIDRFKGRWKEQDDKWESILKARDLEEGERVEYDAYARAKIQEARDLGFDEMPQSLTDSEIQTKAEVTRQVNEQQFAPTAGKVMEQDRPNVYAGDVMVMARAKEGDGAEISSYLRAFARRAGFYFRLGPAEDRMAAGLASPYYLPGRTPSNRFVYMPRTPEETLQRWYGLNRYEILYHEVSHAIDYGFGNLKFARSTDAETGRTSVKLDDPVRLEAIEASKQFKPKIWEENSTHASKEIELMADAIAVWISNPSWRAKMPEFGKKYAKLLEPYVKIAERALPTKTNGEWKPPPGDAAFDPKKGTQEPPHAAGGGGGRQLPPDGPTIHPPEDGGIRPRLPDDTVHLNYDMRAGRFLEGRIGERPPSRGWRGLFNPRVLMRQFVTELYPTRTWDIARGLGWEDFTTEDMARQTYASAPRARYFIEEGPIDALTLNHIEGPAYMDAFDIVRENGGNLEGFEAYRIASRTVELAERGIRSGFDLDEARILVRDGAEVYGEANRVINEAKNFTVDYARDSGVFSEEGAQQMKEQNSSHIVLRRVMNPNYDPTYGGKRRGFNARGLRRIEGSDRPILPPTQADIENLHLLVAMADRNRFVGSVVGSWEAGELHGIPGAENTNMRRIEDANRPRVEVLDQDGNVVYDSRNPPQPGPQDTNPYAGIALWRSIDPNRTPGRFVYYRNGRAELWETNDHELARILRAPGDEPEMNVVKKIMVAFAKFARLGVIASPDFPIRSVARGEVETAINFPHASVPFHNMFVGLWHIMNNTPEYQDAVRKGATGGTFLGMDTRPLVDDINAVFQRTRTYNNAINFMMHPIEAVRSFQSLIYESQPVGYYIRTRNMWNNPIQAGSRARSSSVDISEQAGMSVVNTWHRSTLFLRVATLGLDQMQRAFRERPLSTTMKMLALITLPTIMTWGANQVFDSQYENDPEFRAANPGYVPYRELPRWQRENSYVLPPINGVRIRLPFKPYVYSFFASSLVERSLDSWVLKDKNAATQWWQSFVGQVIPGFIPAIAMPLYEVSANTKSFANAPLVPASLESASGYMRYTPDTTETAKTISRYLSPDVGLLSSLDMGIDIPPIWIDQTARDWAGTVPVQILKGLESSGEWHKAARPWQLTDTPFVGSFVARHPGASADSIQNFYEKMAKIEQKNYDWFLAVKRLNTGEMKELAMDKRTFLRLGAMKTAISARSVVIDAINRNTKLTDDEKLKQTDAIYAGMILTARAGNKIIDSVGR